MGNQPRERRSSSRLSGYGPLTRFLTLYRCRAACSQLAVALLGFQKLRQRSELALIVYRVSPGDDYHSRIEG